MLRKNSRPCSLAHQKERTMSNEQNLLSRRDAMKHALWGAGALAVGAVGTQT
ncbi:MAG: twin-arginine translocation signal domain-containing protein, partial [Acidithiobacillus sp.]